MPTFDTPEPIAVDLDLSVADVQITASDRTDTVVDVRPSNPNSHGDVTAAEQTTVSFANGKLRIVAPKSWRQWLPWSGNESIDVRISLPARSDVRGSGGRTKLE